MKSWTKGDRVVQPTYGTGTLLEVNEHHTVIEFDEHGRRVFSTRLVALQAPNDPALQRKRKTTRQKAAGETTTKAKAKTKKS